MYPKNQPEKTYRRCFNFHCIWNSKKNIVKEALYISTPLELFFPEIPGRLPKGSKQPKAGLIYCLLFLALLKRINSLRNQMHLVSLFCVSTIRCERVMHTRQSVEILFEQINRLFSWSLIKFFVGAESFFQKYLCLIIRNIIVQTQLIRLAFCSER